MGAKNTAKLKLKRPTINKFKCDVCLQKFLSSQALAAHISIHNKVRAKRKVQQRGDLKTLLGNSVKSSKAKKSVEESGLVLDADSPLVMDFRKIEYECPQCHQCFAVYFSAFRHIQKNHCINSKGMKVAPNSMEIIKPLRVEVCMKCNQRLHSNDPHSCVDVCTDIDPMATFICAGCKQQFNSLILFDMHVTGLHSNDIETLFFPNRDEFNLWKEDIESQTKVRYLLLDGKNISKQIYHCTHLTSCDSDEDNVVHFCPSSIFVRDFTKSIQVHYYKQHFGHDCKYKLPAKFIKYRIKHLLKEPTPITEPFELKSLHMDFKTLMNFVLLESTKCDKTTLDILHKKAQEMLNAINNWTDVSKTSKRNMTDDQISETLESLDVKRKKTEIPVEDTKLKSEQIDKVDEKNSAANTDSEKRTRQSKIKKEIKEEVITPVKFILGSSPCSSKSSFNDSYKEFVDKNLKAQAESAGVNKNTYSKSTKQSKQNSPVPKTVGKSNILKDKKKIVKTKIGQFKPSLSPKKNENDTIIEDRRSSLSKIDIKYEVREQENDCNILILKI